MSRKLTVITVVIVLLVAIGATAYALNRNKSDASQKNQNNQQTKDPKTEDGAVTKTGTVICLPHRDTSGPQDLMCAIGMDSDGGPNYALSSNDPTVTGSIPTGQRVKVTGMLKEIQDEKYDSAGTIQVTSIEKL